MFLLSWIKIHLQLLKIGPLYYSLSFYLWQQLKDRKKLRWPSYNHLLTIPSSCSMLMFSNCLMMARLIKQMKFHSGCHHWTFSHLSSFQNTKGLLRIVWNNLIISSKAKFWRSRQISCLKKTRTVHKAWLRISWPVWFRSMANKRWRKARFMGMVWEEQLPPLRRRSSNYILVSQLRCTRLERLWLVTPFSNRFTKL